METELIHTDAYSPTLCVCVCVCVPVFYFGRNRNLNTQQFMGACVTVGTYIEVLMGKQAYKSYRMSFFENVKKPAVSCEG